MFWICGWHLCCFTLVIHCISRVFHLRSVSFKMFRVWLRHRLVFFSEVHSLNRVFFSPVPGRVFQCKLHLLPGTLATHHSLGKTERFTSQEPQKVSRMLPLSLTLELRACKHWTRHRKPLPLPALHSVRLEKKKTEGYLTHQENPVCGRKMWMGLKRQQRWCLKWCGCLWTRTLV